MRATARLLRKMCFCVWHMDV